MDTYENNDLHSEAENTSPAPQSEAVQSDPQPAACHNAGRKESPFADSPYVMNRPEPDYGSSDHSASAAPRKKPRRSPWRGVTAAALALVLAGGSCGATAFFLNDHWNEKTDLMTQQFNQKLSDLQQQLDSASGILAGTSVSGSPVTASGALTPSQVYAKNVGSVVAISNQSTQNIFGHISETASSGSGFVLTEDGYIVSNYHVVQGATSLTVITYDGTEYPAKLVGYDENNDISLLKIDATGLQPVVIGSSDALIVGDMVVAIGNPLGELTSTQTVGYVSAKERDVTTGRSTINMIQTDAAINPGNSGGPLFNMKGEVVGITTAKYSGGTPSGATIEGIGFAIPIDDVYSMLSSIRDHGYVTGAYLGVTILEMDERTANLYQLPMGVLINSVVEGGSADRAGVVPQDIVIGLGEYTVESYSDLSRALRKFQPGDTTTIKVFRAGKEVTLNVTLDEKPNTNAKIPNENAPMPDNGNYDEWYDFFFGQGK